MSAQTAPASRGTERQVSTPSGLSRTVGSRAGRTRSVCNFVALSTRSVACIPWPSVLQLVRDHDAMKVLHALVAQLTLARAPELHEEWAGRDGSCHRLGSSAGARHRTYRCCRDLIELSGLAGIGVENAFDLLGSDAHGEPRVLLKKSNAMLIVASCVGSCGTLTVAQRGSAASPAGVQVLRKS